MFKKPLFKVKKKSLKFLNNVRILARKRALKKLDDQLSKYNYRCYIQKIRWCGNKIF